MTEQRSPNYSSTRSRALGFAGSEATPNDLDDDPDQAPSPGVWEGERAIVIEPHGNPHNWEMLGPEDLRGTPAPEAVAMTRDIVRRAILDEGPAARKLKHLLRATIFATIPPAAETWSQRAHLADDFLSFLLTGFRPSLRQSEPETRPHLSQKTPVAPLQRWLDNCDEPLGAFVYRALANLGLDEIRRGKVQGRWGYTGDPDSIDHRMHDYPDAESRLIEAEQAHLAHLALESLTDRERAVIMGLYKDLSQIEISQQLGINKSRVSQLKAAAIEKLRAAVTGPATNSKGTRK